ncbi:MAG: UvrD-helicase domain-containing protein, partial [bacterium]
MAFKPTDNQSHAIAVPINWTVVVAAGAGTGKTTVLAETVAHEMVRNNGIDINRILVLTFTRKAAAEMAERIEERLIELAGEAQD